MVGLPLKASNRAVLKRSDTLLSTSLKLALHSPSPLEGHRVDPVCIYICFFIPVYNIYIYIHIYRIYQKKSNKKNVFITYLDLFLDLIREPSSSFLASLRSSRLSRSACALRRGRRGVGADLVHLARKTKT